MRKNEKININLNYNPCNITKCSFGNIINNTESELFISGINKSKTKIFFHYFSKDLYSNNKKENTFLFQTWNYSPSKIINYIIPINERNIQNQNSGNINYNQTNGVFLFSSKVELLSFNNKEYNQYIIDDEIYIKPTIENDLLYGLISNIGLKIFNLNKKETESIIYPGKKHIINDYLNFNDNKNIMI